MEMGAVQAGCSGEVTERIDRFEWRHCAPETKLAGERKL